VSGAVALVGFMAAGKSDVGRRAAELAGVPFTDTDALVERAAGSIERIFAEQGEQAFRRLEVEVTVKALGEALERPGVIALGGGAVLSGDVREALRRLPHVAWLTAPPEVLWARVRAAGSPARPLASGEAAFRRLLAERSAVYASLATAMVANDGSRSLDEVAREVADLAGGTEPGAAGRDVTKGR
jgi:shikimate kinase